VSHVVLGAGPAGLGAAYRLARAGHAVTVLERNAVPGGLAGSFEVAGQRVDFGSHRLHPSCAPEIMALLRALLGTDLQQRPRNGRIRLAGRWVAFPPSPGDLVRRLPPPLVAGLALDTLAGPLRRGPRADTFSEVVRSRLGPTLAEQFYFPYMRKIWGIEPDELSGELARRRVGARSLGSLVQRLRTRGVAADRRVFYYPRLAYGEISERLADAAAAAGADIRLGTTVAGIDVAPGHVEVRLDGGHTVKADHAWSTLPLPVLASLVCPAAPAEVRAAADRLEFRGLVLVYLALSRARFTPFDAHYFPGPEVACSRISEPKNYRDNPDDPADRTVLCAEVPASVGDAVWTAPDDELGRLVADGLARVGLPVGAVDEVVVRRLPRTYPVYRVGFEADFDVLDGWADTSGVLTLGRQGLFAHDNTHHALAMAWAAADALDTDGGVDPVKWSAARDAFRAHVVED
jgi:protoporphyrinogen oxidase